MILKPFYDEEDYQVIMKLLHKIKVDEKDIERVKVRQLFLMEVKE